MGLPLVAPVAWKAQNVASTAGPARGANNKWPSGRPSDLLANLAGGLDASADLGPAGSAEDPQVAALLALANCGAVQTS